MSKILRLFAIFAVLSLALAAKKKTGKVRGSKKNDVPKRIILMRTESSINVQLLKARTVEIGFSFIQGADGFVVSAKEWIDGKFEQSVETDRQLLSVQRRSAVLRFLIPGREYLIQVQALGKNRRPFGQIQEKIVRTAQMCYICNGVESNDECSSPTDAVECPHDKDACINVLRYDNGGMSVTKRCAQYDPILAEKAQSSSCPRGDSSKNSVCKCMCRSNLCNRLMLPCVDECLDELPTPMRSSLKCTNGRKVGSVCRWECPTGYALAGLKESKCRADRTWSVMSPPQCIYKTDPRNRPSRTPPVRSGASSLRNKVCSPLPTPDGVAVKCTNGVKQNSVCTVFCQEGFQKEEGSVARVCKNTKWSGKPTVCKEILCPSVASNTGYVNCSKSTKIGSVCNFAEPSTMTCLKDGTWQSSSSCSGAISMYDVKASLSGCEPLPTPSYGNVKCSDDAKEGSVCEYSCANGYSMEGETPLRRCEKGRWSGSPVRCEEMKCGDLKSESFVDSVVKCSNDDKIGSVCRIMTPAQVTCQDNGKWSMPFKQMDKCKGLHCP